MKVETLEKNKRKIVFEVSAERFEEGLKHSYNKNKATINIAGFRKGKAPRKIIEVQYGKEVFYEDAIEFVLPKAYEEAKNESGLEIVAKPEFTGFDMQPDKSVLFTVEVYVKPEVSLGSYQGLTYKKLNTEPTEEEIMEKINVALEKNTREFTISDRALQTDDIAIINFVGYVDGKPFENGSGENYELKIGSHTFIDNFEDQLIGRFVGDDIEVNVRFPDEYHSQDLAGKEALFKVEILEIKALEKPELDDDFASDVSDFDTLAEYKEDIKENIRKEKILKAEQQRDSELIEKLVKVAEMDVPDIMIEERAEELVHEFSHTVTDRGISFDMYLQYIGQTEHSLKESYRSLATNQIKGRFALEALADAENIQVSEDEVLDEITAMAEKYNVEKEKMLAAISGTERKNMTSDLRIQKALDFLKENSTEEA